MDSLAPAIVTLPQAGPLQAINEEAIGIKGFLETSFVDWPGKVASVLFLSGCNFRCPFCHNHSLVENPDGHEDIPLPYIMARLADLEGWVDGVCISGGEPRLAVKLDTNGSRPRLMQSLVEQGLVDCVAMDIKAPLDEMSYAAAAGVAVDLDAIQQSISLLKQGKIEYYFRTTVVPALHKGEDLLHIAHHLSGSSSLTLFSPADPLDQRLKGTSPYPEEWLQEMQERIASILHQ